MVDRATVFPGQLPLETDLLSAQQFGMIGLGELARAILGSPAAVAGFELQATTVPSLSLTLNPGQIYSLQSVEASQWSSLEPDSRPLVRQGILLDPTSFTLVPPNTASYAQVVLIQAQFDELDTAPVERPYYDAANPSVGYTGPGNDGQADNTVRQNTVSLGIKYGTAAQVGTQIAPTPDPGYVGLYLVTLSNGQTQITSANWVTYQPSSFIPVKLPQVPSAVQTCLWTYAQGTGGGNALQASILSYVPPALVAGLRVSVKSPFTNTGTCTFTLNNLPTAPIVGRDGTALNPGDIVNGGICDLMYNGTSWQLMSDRSTTASTFNISDNSLWHIGTPTSGSTVAMTTVLAPVPSAASNGLCMRVPITATNTAPPNNGATTLDFGFGPKPIVVDKTGVGLVGNEMPGGVGHFADFIYDGANCRLMNPVAAAQVAVPLPLGLTCHQAASASFANSVQYIVAGWIADVNTFVTSQFDGQTFTVGAGEGGFYDVAASINLTQLAYDVAVNIRKNGVGTAIRSACGDGNAQSEGAVSCSGYLQLVPGDKITVYQYLETNGAGRSYLGNLSIVRLRS